MSEHEAQLRSRPPVSTHTRLAAISIAWLTTLAAALLSLEAVLRWHPDLIGLSTLDRFHPVLRLKIASDQGLPTSLSRPLIRSSERSDGGPDIHLFTPLERAFVRQAEVDRDLGAIESVSMDQRGFCNADETAQRKSAEVVVLGDSFTWCTAVAVSDTAASRLQPRLSTTVYNVSLPGIGTYEELELFRRVGADLEPRFVVLNFYEGNDLRDIVRYLAFRDRGIQKNRGDPIGGPFARSYALAFLKASLEVMVRTIKSLSGPDFRYSVEADGRRFDMNVEDSDLDEVRQARQIAAGIIREDFLREPLSAYRELAKRHGFSPRIAFIPSAYTAYDGSVIFRDPAVGKDLRKASRLQRQWVKAEAEKQGIEVIDLVPAFQKSVREGELAYFPANVHLTPRGHEIVAQTIADALKPASP